MPRPDAPSWRRRLGLLTADLLVFDVHRLGWRLALRAMAGLLPPLFLAWQLGLPALAWVGIGAFLIAIGDCLDDGDRQQWLRLAVGALLGGLAVAAGVLAGGSLPFAIAGMLFWGCLTGLLGVYGNAFAVMALPIAWAYVELGLPSRDHSLGHAAALGALFALGGGLTLALTRLIRLGGPYAPLQAQTAACFRALAGYFGTLGGAADDGPRAELSPETRVRAAIAEARRVAAQARASQQGSSRVNQHQVVLIEIADRLFSLAAVLREAPAEAAGLPLARFADAARGLAEALRGRPRPEVLRRLLDELDDLAAAGGAPVFGDVALGRRLAEELSHATHVLLGDAALPEGPAPPAATVRLSRLLAPLAACLDRESVVARHAVRFAVVAAVSVVIFWFFPPPFGYWVPLTVTVVLKPYAGMTLGRTLQRIVGTAAGILVSMALMPLLPTPPAQLAAIAVAFFWMMAVLPFNYSLGIFFLSAGLIPFEHFLVPDLRQDVGLLRLVGTAIGAALAVIGGYLLWPSFERSALPALLRASLRSMAGYAEAALALAAGRADREAVEAARRRAGFDTTNLQAAVQHAASEIGGDPAALQAAVLAAVALQRLANTANAVMNLGPVPLALRPELAPLGAAIVSAMERLAEGGKVPPDALAALRAALPGAGDAAAAFLRRELERLVSQIEILCDALSRSGARRS